VIARVIKDECVNELKNPTRLSLKKVFVYKKTKLKPTFFDFLQSAKNSPYKKTRHDRKKITPSHFPPISEKSTNFSCKLVDKFCECRHKLLTQVFQKTSKSLSLKKCGVFHHQHFSQIFLHQVFPSPSLPRSLSNACIQNFSPS